MKTISHWIDNQVAIVSDSEATLTVTDPATGKVTASVAVAGEGEVNAAVASAQKAFDSWSEASISARTRVMFAFRSLLDANRDELAKLITAEHGKVHADALGEVNRGIEVVEFACGIGEILKTDRSASISTGHDAYTLRQPLGVVAGITPFNFPAMVPMWMFPVAIACGNSFVLKPSEKDPSASMLIAELFEQAGLPAGVFNVIQGNADTVNLLLNHPGVDAVSFVGSTPIAQHVHKTASLAHKRVQALGGAKNHMIVLPDADMELAADAAVSAGYGSAGERCMAISVVVAVGDTGDQLIDAISQRIDALNIGPGALDAGEPAADMGPLVTGEHRDRVVSYIDSGEAAGAVLVRDGRGITVDNADCANGFWVGPTLLDHVTTDMDVYKDEIFGPVLSVVRVDSYDEAIALLRANPYGNGVALFTRDGGASRSFVKDIPVGMVGVNVAIPVPMAYHSFGGWKDSLFGDHHMHGPEGVRFYTRLKAVTETWPDPRSRGVNLGFPNAD